MSVGVDDDWCHRIEVKLSERCAGPRSPAAETEIREFATLLGFEPSSEFSMIYKAFNGFSEDGASWISLWSMQEIIAERARWHLPTIVFADRMIHSHTYALDVSKDGNSVIDVDTEEHVANSLKEFLEAIVNGDFDLPPARIRGENT